MTADLGPALFAPVYGMVTDRFGITWVFGLTQGGGSGSGTSRGTAPQ